MILVPFFKIPHGDRLAKNVKKRHIPVILRSTIKLMFLILIGDAKDFSLRWSKWPHDHLVLYSATSKNCPIILHPQMVGVAMGAVVYQIAQQ